MLRNRLIAGVLSAVMCTSAVLPNQALNNAGHEANAATEKDRPISSDYDIKSTNSLGNFFKHAAAKEDVQNPLAENACNSQFQITALEFDNETGKVSTASTQQTEAKIVVSFINDETSENIFSVETAVSAGELINSELKADTSKLPQYYLVKAQLFDPLNRPVGKPYTLNRYTKEYQEILAKDIHDFDQEQVVNLDEDDTTNFLVLNEDTVMAESSEDQNTLVSADFDNNVFVFDNADESITSLEKGEYLYIQPDEDNIIAVSVEKIEKDGDTVTVSGNDDIEDMFDFIKIESDGNMGKAQIDTSAADEGVSFPNVDENGDVIVDDDGTFDFEYVAPQHDLKFDYSASKTFSLDSLFDPTTEDTTPNDPYEDFNVKNADKVSGSVTISVNFNFFKKFGTTKIELTVKVTPAFTVTKGFSGSGYSEPTSSKVQSLGATIAKIVIPTSIPGTIIDISPRVFVEFSGKITFTVKWDNVRGFKYEDGEVEPIEQLLDDKNFDISLKISGEIYAGLELKLYMEVVNENIAAVGFDIKAGIRIKAEADLFKLLEQYEKNMNEPPDNVIINNGETKPYYHACKFCIQAKTDFVVKVNLDICALRKKKSWNLFDFSINLPFFNAYFSSEKGFGWGDCYYNRFRTTFNVISSSDGGYIPGAVVKLDDKEQTIGDSGNAVFYCLPGTYSYSVTYNGSSLESGNLKIDNRHTEKTVKAKPTVDKDGNPDGGYNQGSSYTETGEAVTQPTTTKPPFVAQTLPAPSFTKDEMIAETGELGEHISYMLYPDGYLYACGYGDMYDFSSSPFRDPSIIKYVVIENTGDKENGGIITSIGNNVFVNCSNMESINLPQTIKRIGKNAFRKCSSFSTVSYDIYDYEKEKVVEVRYPEGKLVMPEDITFVDEYAFANCTSLKDIVIPKTITEIPNYTFSGCTGITSIEVPDSVNKICDYVFSDCTSLKTAVIKNCKDGIGNHIFSGCAAIEDITIPYMGHSLAEVNADESTQQFSDFFLNGNTKEYNAITNYGGWTRYIPKSLTSVTVTGGTRIPNYAFYNINSAKTITVPKTITTFGNYSFANCNSLESTDIHEGITSIGNYAFSNCSSAAFKTVTFPKTLTSIGNNAFSGCKNLTGINVPKTVKSLGSYAFSDCTSIKSAVIAGGENSIGDHVFSGCKSLAELTIPFIGSSAAGANDPKVTSQVSTYFLNGNTTDYYAITNYGGWTRYIPNALKKITVTGGSRVSDYAFYRLSGVETITIPDATTAIGKYAFEDCKKAAFGNVNFTKSLISIGEYAYSNCFGLTGINIPENVKTIGSYAFSNCSALEKAVINGGADGIGIHIFTQCKSLAELTLPFAGFDAKSADDPEVTSQLTTYFLNGSTDDYYAITNYGGWTRYIPKALKKITILGGKRISDYAFYRFTGVESIVIPESITEIGNYAFADCSSNINSYIPEGVTSIGNHAFSNCSSTDFNDVEFHDALASIGDYAFSGCKGLTSITVPDTLTSIGSFAFSDCSSLEKAVIEGGSDGIGNHVFSGCKSLAEMTIPFVGSDPESADDPTVTSQVSTYFLNGDTTDYYAITNYGGWTRYIPKALKKITVTGGTRLSNYAFYRLHDVETISIPDSMTEIGKYAFAQCYNAAFGDLKFSEKLTSIEEYAFLECYGLTGITIPENVKTIGNYVFTSCSALKTAVIKGGADGIGIHIFDQCKSLAELTLPFAGFDAKSIDDPDSTCQISTYFLNGSTDNYYAITNYGGWTRYIPKSLKKITILGGKRIPNYAFYRFGGVTDITIPDNITSIGNYAFADCTSLTEAPMPSTLTSIGNYAFSNCSSTLLKPITFPDTLTSIGDYAFSNCNGLKSITVPETVLKLGSFAFNSCDNLVKADIYGGVNGIGNHVFSECVSIESITLPFAGFSLADVNKDNSKQEIIDYFLNGNTDKYYAITNTGGWTRYIPNSLKTVTILGGSRIPDYTFYRMSKLTNITVPNDITSIGKHAFDNCISADFKDVVISDTVKSIGEYAFSNCDGLTGIVIPESVTSIGNYVFDNCDSLKKVDIFGDEVKIGSYIFNNCKSLESITLPFAGSTLDAVNAEDSSQQISEFFLNGSSTDHYAITNLGGWTRYIPKSLKTIVINGGKKIPKYTFYRMLGVEDVYLPKGVTNIADNSFDGCSGIQNVFYPSTRADWEKNVTVGANNEEIDGKVRFLG
ncbi:leucine-rich repeat domain-containing protein, partial [Ruminococcus flavefaciens]|uniref:leucine-rich repeat domain-containing protein n=1 Tax=Ruminococcus flavefaciens TaxID=1265 RepID=UPI001A985368